MNKKKSNIILVALKNHYGDVMPDLKYSNIYELTIAVVLSARTTDRQVNSITPELFLRYPDFKSLAAAETVDVESIVKSTGFYKNKAKNIIALSKIVEEEFCGAVPDTREAIMKLPGAGRKSANVILSMGHNIPALAVDTHVMRIAKRLGYTSASNPLDIENDLTAIIPREDWTESHLLFIRHGRKICTARSPICEKCPVAKWCKSAFTF